jgi:hypothetical protein
MRRKLPPQQPFARSATTRPLSAALARSRLPTAAALALALSSLGCASRSEEVSADPAAVRAPLVVPSAAPSTSASPGLNVIDPEPHALPGEAAIVAPVAPVASTTAKPKHVPVTIPTIKHRTAGVPPRVHPHDPFD